MKKMYIFVAVAFFFVSSCEYGEYNPENEIDIEKKEFIEWVTKFDYELAETYYDKLSVNFLVDARSLSNGIEPFSLKDVVTHKSEDSLKGENYNFSNDQGTTSVYYYRELIFHNSWGYPYMGSTRMMTMISFGELNKIKLLLIENHSTFPPDERFNEEYYGYEKRSFAEINGKLQEFKLEEMGVSYGIWDVKVADKKDVILIKSTSFVRSYPRYNYISIIHLPSKEFKVLCSRY